VTQRTFDMACLQRFLSTLAGANAHGEFNGIHKDPAIASLAGLRGLLDHLDHAPNQVIGRDDLQL
jgi:hypothetical protein